MSKAGRRQTARTVPKEMILYIEDQPENWHVAELQLGDRYDLRWASNDRQACAFLRKCAHELTAVLMDIQLQGSQLDGVQLTRLIRGQLPKAQLPEFAWDIPPSDVPIIFVTAYGHHHSENELMAYGGNALVAKPVDFVALTLAIARVHLERTKRAGARPENLLDQSTTELKKA